MDVIQTLLPGIGVRYEFATASGRKVSVVSHRDGRQELYVNDAKDPDAMREVLILNHAEADALAEILGAPHIAEQLGDLHREIPELVTERIVLPRNSPYVGRPLGDTRLRTRTGASVVAIVRGDQVVPSPAPDFVLEDRDTLVVVGTSDGCRAAGDVLNGLAGD